MPDSKNITSKAKKNNKQTARESKKAEKAKNFRKKESSFSLRRGICTGFFAVMLFLIICTTFQNFIYKHIYEDETAVTITAEAQKSSRSLGTYVRINEIYVNGVTIDMSDMATSYGWKYDGINNLLYVENPADPVSVNMSFSDVRTIDIKYVTEEGSGKFTAKFNRDSYRSVDAYKNVTWGTKTISYKVNPLIRPYDSYGLLICIFLLFFAIAGFAKPRNSIAEKIYSYIEFIDEGIILSAVIYLFISFMQRESISATLTWIRDNSENFMEGFVILVLINTVLASLFKSNRISFVIVSLVSIVFVTINYFKLQFRDTPFLPWDFMLAGEVTTVLSKFRIVPSLRFAAAFFAALIVTGLILFCFRKKKKADTGIFARVAVIIVSLALGLNYFYTDIFEKNVNLFEIKDFYTQKGFVSAFAETAQYLLPMDPPEGYNKDTMQKIHDKINAYTEDAGQKPNVIVLMSESFWDITRVKELNFNEEIFPNYRNLQKTAVTGELLTNIFGGGTVNSEFEALTGFSTDFLPDEFMPYQRYIRPGFFSVNSFLESIGYESLGMHPFEKTNYNRSTAYEYFGFDETVWEEDFDEDSDRMRGYISDHALTQKIIEEYEKHNASSSEPWFNMSVSMQNHGGYWETSLDKGKEVDIDTSKFLESSQGSIEDLATGLHYADLALGELIDYFEKEEEPTLIIMFGDHMSDAGPVGQTLIEQSSLLNDGADNTNDPELNSILQQHRVPFIAWSNFADIHKDCGIISVNQLLPTVFSEYNVSMPRYFSYLRDCQNVCGAYGSAIMVNKDGTLTRESELTGEQKAIYDENWLIEYDYLFGENYLKDLFDYKPQK